MKKNLLKSYKQIVQDLLEEFQAFNIQSVPRNKNKHADRISTIGTHYDIPEQVADDKEKQIRIFLRPIFLDNCTNWKVFDSNVQIVNFLQNEAKFSAKNQSHSKVNMGTRS